MSSLVFHHAPNRIVASAALGDTGWHQLTLPAGLPPKSGIVNCTVAICTLAAAGGAGSVALVGFDSASAPSVGWPLLTTEVFALNNNIWYQLTTATDTIYFLFSF